jgi:uncharacterized protein (TIGR03437 family)
MGPRSINRGILYRDSRSAVSAVIPAGIVAGSIGLYQFNLVVPNVAAGDQPIELTVDGVSTGQNMVIVVGQ